jgi:hypothetical protein
MAAGKKFGTAGFDKSPSALQAMLDTSCCQWQQDFKIVHSYYPALLAMLKDEIYFLLHLQQHGLQHCKQCWIIRMYGVHSDEIYFLLHLQQHGRMYGVHSDSGRM